MDRYPTVPPDSTQPHTTLPTAPLFQPPPCQANQGPRPAEFLPTPGETGCSPLSSDTPGANQDTAPCPRRRGNWRSRPDKRTLLRKSLNRISPAWQGRLQQSLIRKRSPDSAPRAICREVRSTPLSWWMNWPAYPRPRRYRPKMQPLDLPCPAQSAQSW